MHQRTDEHEPFRARPARRCSVALAAITSGILLSMSALTPAVASEIEPTPTTSESTTTTEPTETPAPEPTETPTTEPTPTEEPPPPTS